MTNDPRTLAWLQDVCSTESYRVEALGHPWTITFNGEPWTVATNGWVLAATRGDFGYPPPSAVAPDFASVMVEPAIPPRILPLPALRLLALPWAVADLPDCATCQNRGQVDCERCDGIGEIECECHCGDVHDTECGDCDGEGVTGCEDCSRGAAIGDAIRPVEIDGTPFNLRLFAKVLPHLPGDEAEWRQSTRAAHVRLGAWRLVFMPLRTKKDGGKDFPDAPRITLTEPAHV